MTGLSRDEAESFLFLEASHLDQHRWSQWLELFTDDCRFWVPAWRSEHEPTDDPRTQASLVFAAGKRRLAERVTRVQEGKTPTAQPLPRTLHVVTNVQVAGESGESAWRVDANWMVHRFNIQSAATDTSYGRYEYVVRRQAGMLMIADKKVILINDRVATYVDFFCV